jgi:AraC-like DNA-binding protein
MEPLLALACDVLPRIFAAGLSPHRDRDFSVHYDSPTHALHLYLYPCQMRWGSLDRAIAIGDVTLTPAHVPARYHLEHPGFHWCVHFWPIAATAAMFSLPWHLRLGRRSEAALQRMSHLSQLFTRARAPGQHGLLAMAAAQATLQELLLSLALDGTGEPGVHAQRAQVAVERVASLIHDRFSEALTVPQLAREVGMSQNHLASRFRERFGVTIPGFLVRRRVERARQLLGTTNLPVQAVGAAVGWQDAQHFNKQFRRLTGHSPSAERLG